MLRHAVSRKSAVYALLPFKEPAMLAVWVPVSRALPIHACASRHMTLRREWACRAYDSGQAPHTRQPEGVVAARVHLADTLSHPYDALFCSRGAVFLCAGSPAALANPRYAVRTGQPGMRLRRGYHRAADGATGLGPGGVCGCFSQVRPLVNPRT